MTHLTKEQIKEKAREDKLLCQFDESRGVLLSNPPQHKCKRDRCNQTWIVGQKAPLCEMYDIDKHLDTLIDQVWEARDEWWANYHNEQCKEAYTSGYKDAQGEAVGKLAKVQELVKDIYESGKQGDTEDWIDDLLKHIYDLTKDKI